MLDYPVPGLPDLCWPVDVSCISDWDAWDVEPDPSTGEEGVPVYTEAQKDYAAALAAMSLRALTGYRLGGCPVTARPQGQGCRERTWRATHGPGDGSTPWKPVNLNGEWVNVGGCGHGGADPATYRLPPSVTRILEVKVDGMTLDPTAYRLDRGGYLVRMDGDWWPQCQDLTAEDTEIGTWSVTYQAGIEVDGIGARMAGIMAGQFLSACTGGDCDLPAAVTQIVRQGVTLDLAAGVFPEGRTGIREVDAFIIRYNPNRLRAPSVVWSPDIRRPRAESSRNPYVPPLDGIDGGAP